MMVGAPALVLASASETRRRLLASTGLAFEAVAAWVDEDSVKREARVLGAAPEATALQLARLKAQAVGRPEAIVIGCDQILVCGGQWFDKPVSLEAAAAQLRSLRGRTHVLATAMVVLRGGVEVWQHVTAPRLTMRGFSEAFLARYLAVEGDAVLGSVGAYQLEGLGVHLFDAVEGEHSAVLGLPLPPLLGFLRGSGMLLV